MGIVGSPKKESIRQQTEVSINFVSQNSVRLKRANLESALSKLWDLESLGIKEGTSCTNRSKARLTLLMECSQLSYLGNKVITPFPVIMKTVCRT